MLTIPVYNSQGEKIGEESINPDDFGGTVNKVLMHEVVLMHLANRRVGTVNTRGRADVAGSGKKLFRQKGTGNARAGSKRTNKRKGGGVAFARRNRYYGYALPKRSVRAAVKMALLSKFQQNQAIILESLPLDAAKPKTKDVAQLLTKLPRPDFDPAAPLKAAPHPNDHKGVKAAKKREAAIRPQVKADSKATALLKTLHRRSVLLGLPGHDPVAYRAARNIEGVKVAPVDQFNTYDVLRQRYLVLTRDALKALVERVRTQPARRPESSVATAGASEN